MQTINVSQSMKLTYSSHVLHFYTPRKRQKFFGFLKFSEGIEMEQMKWIKCFKIHE